MMSGPLLGAEASLCRGTVANGRLEHGCRMPRSGPNFEAYSSLGVGLGRTYVHCTVARVVEAAYAQLAKEHSDLRFVYGETGFEEGGRFKPHRTHQNGLSVDFFVPVRNRRGESVPLGTNALNKWGYDIEFDTRGPYEDLRIDFDAIALHLAALSKAAKREGIGIAKIIFDPKLQPLLKRSPEWARLKGSIPLSPNPAWIRHDEHFHVDFAVACKPL
jgi:penicillin-insensitive murein endopeptidase